jgi:Ca2+-binding RTX toxin-like protein
MRIKGSNKADHLLGTAGDDVISGGRGNDWVEGGSGNDTLTGDAGRDTFVIRANGGHDTVTDFHVGEDFVMFDTQTGVYDGLVGNLPGMLSDGESVFNSHGTLVCTVHAGDYNGDGVVDTTFEMSSGASLTLLGVDPSTLGSADLFGG